MTCDLVYFFDRVMRCYTPALATDSVPPALAPGPDRANVPLSPNLAITAPPTSKRCTFALSLRLSDTFLPEEAPIKKPKRDASRRQSNDFADARGGWHHHSLMTQLWWGD